MRVSFGVCCESDFLENNLETSFYITWEPSFALSACGCIVSLPCFQKNDFTNTADKQLPVWIE